jgi:copper chaperone
MKTVLVDNIKCGGCAHRIEQKLTDLRGVSEVKVNIEEGAVLYEVEDAIAEEKIMNTLAAMGYPKQGESTVVDSAKSYVSCMIGRVTK